MKMAESAPPLVLVTGASGFVSTWLIKELLEKGEYRVRGTVRDKSKEEKVCLSNSRVRKCLPVCPAGQASP